MTLALILKKLKLQSECGRTKPVVQGFYRATEKLSGLFIPSRISSASQEIPMQHYLHAEVLQLSVATALQSSLRTENYVHSFPLLLQLAIPDFFTLKEKRKE